MAVVAAASSLPLSRSRCLGVAVETGDGRADLHHAFAVGGAIEHAERQRMVTAASATLGW